MNKSASKTYNVIGDFNIHLEEQIVVVKIMNIQ